MGIFKGNIRKFWRSISKNEAGGAALWSGSLIRKGFGSHELNTKKFLNQEEFQEFHECFSKVTF
jgi:hypothetical protein